MTDVKVEFYQTKEFEGDNHRWRLRAANSEIIASGEGYSTKDGAERGFEAVARAVLETVAYKLGTGGWPE